ncbi:MAG TPA: HAD family hydrolase [Candidatus Ozemobacteraceae bacterium]|nr:HAD family hydrolase [Candidatus Ozemobacteraceae bacterium]
MDITPYCGIVFDLDGTLLDTLADIADSTNRVLRRHGFAPHPLDAYRYFVGDGMRMLAERALPADRRTPELIDEVFRAVHAEYDRHWADITRPYDGVPELLDGLRERGIEMSVLSNKPEEFTVMMVRHYFPGVPFKRVYGAGAGIPRKPDPAGALRIAAESGLDPSLFMYLGDTMVDMKTAVAAGMFPIGALWGFREEAELREGGAKLLVAHPGDILDA